ncbi:lantibiotic dehydratase [Nocardia amamiensis]|uniref:lantibiotic dehydratase n=1 Tax=Nocardia amamiensis TaxID=404578 RepID=UPI0033F727A4
MASEISLGHVVEPAEFFVARVPALPFSTLTDWSAGVEAPWADAAELDEALARDRALLGSRLQSLCGRIDISSALLEASPDLVRAITDGGAPPLGEIPNTVPVRAQIALVRYLFRMASRPTPFGLFAACGVGAIGRMTSLSIPPRDSWRRKTMLDGTYLDALLMALCDSPELRDRLTLRPNETITRVAGRLRLLRRRPPGDERQHQMVEVRPTLELERALDAAGPGARVPDIAAAVAAPRPMTPQQLDFVRALVKAQILVADLQLPVTGATPLDALIDGLENVGAALTTTGVLRAVRDALDRLDDAGGVQDPISHHEIRDQLAQIRAATAPTQPFHTSLSLPRGGLNLARATAGDIERAVRLLIRIAPPSAPDELANFKLAFAERYGRREVPLAEALDDRIGVGFGTPWPEHATLLDGLLPNDRPAPLRPFTRRDAALLEMVVRAADSGSHEVDLKAADIEALAAESPSSAPASFAVVASLANTTGGPQILFSSCAGPSGLGALGRFCHADRDLAGFVERHLQDEAALDPDAVFAEIVHLSGSASINFLARPLLREWEIEWLGRSGAAPDRRLSIADLLVSVRDDQVELRSKRLGRRVVPRLTSAHNWTSSRTLPIYRFLCSLQEQGCAGLLYWDWGPLRSAAFLPRVRWGRVVFSRARWLLASSELDLGERESWRAVQTIRARRGLPRWVVVVEEDNELVVDLDNVLSVDSFAQLLRSRGSTIVKEMFPGPDELVAQGADGAYIHQLIVPFIAKATTAPKSACARAVDLGAGPPPPRIFAPCGEWVALELNSGTALADRLLLEMVAPLVGALLADGTTDCWYFARFNGRSPGIAVHAHGNPDLLVPALRGLAAQALDVGMARDASFRTHVQQAGAGEVVVGPTASERLAQADSRAAVDLLSVLGADNRRQDDRWRICLVGVDRWLCDVGLDLDQRLAYARAMSRALARGQRLADGASRRLGERFRAERFTLGRLLAAPKGSDPFAPCIAILDRRTAGTVSIIAQLANTGDPTQDLYARKELTAALAHGWVNRVMRSRDRTHEWAIYELLRRLYEASIHRRSAAGRPNPGAAEGWVDDAP